MYCRQTTLGIAMQPPIRLPKYYFQLNAVGI